MSFPAYTPKARVQKPAPAFAGTAVVDGTFEGASIANGTHAEDRC
jgi:peroxiredoxin (alkyl hydroperoxide reductase subunit C)